MHNTISRLKSEMCEKRKKGTTSKAEVEVVKPSKPPYTNSYEGKNTCCLCCEMVQDKLIPLIQTVELNIRSINEKIDIFSHMVNDMFESREHGVDAKKKKFEVGKFFVNRGVQYEIISEIGDFGNDDLQEVDSYMENCEDRIVKYDLSKFKGNVDDVKGGKKLDVKHCINTTLGGDKVLDMLTLANSSFDDLSETSSFGLEDKKKSIKGLDKASQEGKESSFDELFDYSRSIRPIKRTARFAHHRSKFLGVRSALDRRYRVLSSGEIGRSKVTTKVEFKDSVIAMKGGNKKTANSKNTIMLSHVNVETDTINQYSPALQCKISPTIALLRGNNQQKKYHKGIETKAQTWIKQDQLTSLSSRAKFENSIMDFLRIDPLIGQIENEIIVDFAGISGTRDEFDCLLPRKWLNSTIIDLVVKMCSEEAKEEIPSMRRWYLPTHFHQFILCGGAEVGRFIHLYQNGEKYMSTLDYCEQIFIPMNDSNAHWYLVVIDFTKTEVLIFDSLPLFEDNPSRRLQTALVIQFCEEMFRNPCFKTSNRQFGNITTWPVIIPDSVPKQQNTYDCGIYTIMFMMGMHFKDYRMMESNHRSRTQLAYTLVCHRLNKKRDNIMKRIKLC